MAAEGALIATGPDRFGVSSPLICNLLLSDVVSVDRDQCIPSAVPALKRDAGGSVRYRYDIPALVAAAIPFFDRTALARPLRAFKRSRVDPKHETNVPEEAAYHFHLSVCFVAGFHLTRGSLRTRTFRPVRRHSAVIC